MNAGPVLPPGSTEPLLCPLCSVADTVLQPQSQLFFAEGMVLCLRVRKCLPSWSRLLWLLSLCWAVSSTTYSPNPRAGEGGQDRGADYGPEHVARATHAASQITERLLAR